ncbi:helix-turn-helix domain-containing protein [Paraburkholderia rhizosphaerae]|uniref:AraC-like DNA-binding protein n=1 Tax=Paraburkholderia rhizosphaerae TaxID=480658 RepID=A0A4R8LIL1_9BURK|nr:AraC family transcriptional regulator [Paraburkholderia rhizosphaerae]TDY43264.1 AraC-like DNA-binding protein [Paraburkholderia rhizosphaerae]
MIVEGVDHAVFERPTPVAAKPSFLTVQVQAAQGHAADGKPCGTSAALFFDLTTRTIHSYVLDGYVRTHATGTLRRVRGGLSPAHLQLAKAMLSIRDHDKVTLTALGRACGLSPSHFAREFKQSTGLPPHRWALKNKVSRAQDMLLHSGLTLPAIAFACGFVDQSHLGRWFKRLTGLSPKAWQRLHLDGDRTPGPFAHQ